MGTRHQQKTINIVGETKVSQYGQWDGYPSGQGLDILNYLKTGNLTKYQENLEKLKILTKEQHDIAIIKNGVLKKYAALSRDLGAEIHNAIETGIVNHVYHISDDEALFHCLGFYTIDFKENLFTSRFNGFEKSWNLHNLPTEEEYLESMSENNDFDE
jgi:hypothetical protein